MRALVWPVATYGCESWTLKASDKKRIAGFETTAYRRMLRFSWKDHRTNQSILEELQDTNARLLNDNLCTSILHGRIAGTRKHERPQRRWTDDNEAPFVAAHV